MTYTNLEHVVDALLSVEQAGRVAGMSKSKATRLIKLGEFPTAEHPVPVLRSGSCQKISGFQLIRCLRGLPPVPPDNEA